MKINEKLIHKLIKMQNEELRGMVFKINDMNYILTNSVYTYSGDMLYSLFSLVDFNRWDEPLHLDKLLREAQEEGGEYLGKISYELDSYILSFPLNKSLIESLEAEEKQEATNEL